MMRTFRAGEWKYSSIGGGAHIWPLGLLKASATTVENMCEVNLVTKICFQFGVLACLIGLNCSGVFSIFDLGEAGL